MEPVLLLTFVACHTKHCMDTHGIKCRPVPVNSQIFHIATEMKLVFITKQNECGVCCFFVHPVKVPVHRIQFCFTTCIIVYVKLTCVM
jgi:hypothetical protein